MKRGFHITTLHADGEFSPLQVMVYKHVLGGPRINITIANEHIPEIELRIRVVKERTRAFRHSLPFNKISKLITIYIVFKIVRMIKYFPVKVVVSAILSPKTIMSGETLYYKRHLGLNIGQYFQVHEHEEPRKVEYQGPKAPFSLDPVEMNKGGSNL